MKKVALTLILLASFISTPAFAVSIPTYKSGGRYYSNVPGDDDPHSSLEETKLYGQRQQIINDQEESEERRSSLPSTYTPTYFEANQKIREEREYSEKLNDANVQVQKYQEHQKIQAETNYPVHKTLIEEAHPFVDNRTYSGDYASAYTQAGQDEEEKQ